MSRGIIVIENVLESVVLENVINDAEEYSHNKFKISEATGSKPTDWIESYFNTKLNSELEAMISKRMLRDYEHTIDILVQEKTYNLLVEYYKERKLFAFSDN